MNFLRQCLSINMSSFLSSIGIVASIFTALLAVLEYKKQGKQKRVELLEHYRMKFQTDEYCKAINPLIEEDSENLKNVDQMHKYYYLGLFEELAVLINSRIIRVDTVYYFFGYYALNTWKSENFWGTVNRNSIYWKEFSNFVKLMEQTESEVLKRNSSLMSFNKWRRIKV